jgi:hypothetical protein
MTWFTPPDLCVAMAQDMSRGGGSTYSEYKKALPGFLVTDFMWIKRDSRSWRRGQAHRDAKVTENQVREMRAKYPRETIAAMSREYGISESAVRNIVKGRGWKHVQ